MSGHGNRKLGAEMILFGVCGGPLAFFLATFMGQPQTHLIGIVVVSVLSIALGVALIAKK